MKLKVLACMDEVTPGYMSEILADKATVAENLKKLNLDLQTTLNESR